MIYKSNASMAGARSSTEYLIVRANELPELVDEVNSLMRRGWLPVGGVAYRGDDICVQAMYRLKKKDL